MWKTFSQRLSISVIHAFITETACVNNSKKELDYYRNLSQISLIIMQHPCPPKKILEWAGLLPYDLCTYIHVAIGTISIYPHMGNYRGCCSLRGHTPTLIASMHAMVLATAPPLLCVGEKKVAHENYPSYGVICTLKNYTSNLL